MIIMNRKLQFFGFLLGVLLMMSITSGVAIGTSQASSDNVQVSTGNLVVKVTGGSNVPMYTFWNVNNNATKYKVQFSQVFEAIDNPNSGTNGSYDLGTDTKVAGAPVSLSALSWTFSNVSNDNNGNVNFNLTSSDGTFQFRNHLTANNLNSMKFDVLINNYQFKSNESMLVLAFKVLVNSNSTDRAPSTQKDNSSSVGFSNGYFQSAGQANAGNHTVQTGLSTGSDNGAMIYLAYQNFNGTNLVHDPTLGVQASASNPTDTSSGTGPALASASGTAGLNFLFLSAMAIFVPVAIYRNRQ